MATSRTSASAMVSSLRTNRRDLAGLRLGVVAGRLAWRAFAQRLGLLPELVAPWPLIGVVTMAGPRPGRGPPAGRSGSASATCPASRRRIRTYTTERRVLPTARRAMSARSRVGATHSLTASSTRSISSATAFARERPPPARPTTATSATGVATRSTGPEIDREHDGAGRRHSGNGGAGRCATSGARLIDLDAHHRRPSSRVAGTHAHAAYPSQSPFTSREAHRADGAPDDSPALGPHTPPIAESVSSEMVAVDEPGVKAGQDI